MNLRFDVIPDAPKASEAPSNVWPYVFVIIGAALLLVGISLLIFFLNKRTNKK